MAIKRINPDSMYKPWENSYTQVVCATGTTQIHISGTVGLDANRNPHPDGDKMATQVKHTVENIERSLIAAGATLADVVRVNIFSTDVDAYLQEGHAEMVKAFGDTLPASTLVGVTRLAHPSYLVEIQATAVID